MPRRFLVQCSSSEYGYYRVYLKPNDVCACNLLDAEDEHGDILRHDGVLCCPDPCEGCLYDIPRDYVQGAEDLFDAMMQKLRPGDRRC